MLQHKASELRQTPLSAAQVEGAWQTLLAAIDGLAGARQLSEILAVVLKGARALCGADGVTFVLKDGDECHYYEEDAITPLWKGQRFPANSCISGWCMINRATAVVSDIHADPRIPAELYSPTFVRSLVMVPVPAEPMAAIGIYWKTEVLPSPFTVTMLESLAKSTAAAMRHVAIAPSADQSTAR